MKQLRPPDGARRGLRRVKCDVNDDLCTGSLLYRVKVHTPSHNYSVDGFMCEYHRDSAERLADSFPDVAMTWRELSADEYETTA